MSEQSQFCPNTYVTPEGKTVACMGYMIERPDNLGYYNCSCGYSVKIQKTIVKGI